MTDKVKCGCRPELYGAGCAVMDYSACIVTELLEALEEFMELEDAPENFPLVQRRAIRERASAALSKARGAK